MTISSSTAAFFEIDNTLATVRLSASGDHIEEVTVYPGIVVVLKALIQDGVRLGIISHPGAIPAPEVRWALERSGILPFFEESLILSGTRLSPRLFREGAALVSLGEESGETTLLYVDDDAGSRAQARAAGFRTAPHPALARQLIHQQVPLQYLRIHLPNDDLWRTELGRHAVIPFYVSPPASDRSGLLYGIADAATVRALDGRGFAVDRLGSVDAPQNCEVYFVRTMRQAPGAVPAAPEMPLVSDGSESATPFLLDATDEGLIVALSHGTSVSSLRLQGARHLHPVKLVPSVMLLQPAKSPPVSIERLGDPSLPRLLQDCEVEVLTRCIRADIIAQDVARYAGNDSTSQDPRIWSRHIFHPDNARAVEVLAYHLTQAGPNILQVRREPFRHEQRTLHNVVAILPRAANDTRKEIVVVGAHLDSTATNQPCYRPCIDPAPGADDDASGIAGVLAAARACVELASLGILHREIRFVLFNSEEVGIAGSGVYASNCKANREVILAMFQMDMIGHDLAPPRRFELHAGLVPQWPDDGVALQAASRGLADLIVRLHPEVSDHLQQPQIFADSTDPGVEHSDHSRFHFAGYPACLASEDFFPGLGDAGDRNPHYHRPTDVMIDAGYAADIARVVAAAAWVAATR